MDLELFDIPQLAQADCSRRSSVWNIAYMIWPVTFQIFFSAEQDPSYL